MPRLPRVLLLLAAVSALAAAGGLSLPIGEPPRVAVLVDVSSSTRGMWFRDPKAVRAAVDRVIGRLAPGASVATLSFADGDPHGMEPVFRTAADRTVLPSIPADAVLLLSDGRLDAEADQSPIYPVMASQDDSRDARVVSVDSDGAETTLAIVNDGPPRTLTWPDGTTSEVPHGSVRLASRAAANAGTARLNAGDLWPENDAVELRPAVQMAIERWWIGTSPAPAGYRGFSPKKLPPADEWLAAAVVVLNNVPADALNASAMRSLSRYVRDCGGSLVIVGGGRAFSAGRYGGTELDALSPLASRPPQSQREWLMLIDVSGSMAQRGEDGRTRLEAAVGAADAAVAALPASDAVTVASFARELQPWPAVTQRHIWTPAGLTASGPTNLRAALETLIKTRSTPAPLPIRVLAITDGDAELGEAAGLGASLRDAGITLDWLQLGDARAAALADVVRATGGSVVPAGAARDWRAAAVAAVKSVEHIDAAPSPVAIRWRDTVAAGESMANQADATWLWADAEILATRVESADVSAAPIAARWQVGTGRVIALAYAASPVVADRMAAALASSPRDPRFTVRWNGGSLTVDAAEGGAAMNDLSIDARNVDADPKQSFALTQIAPGRYAGLFASDPQSRTVATRLGSQTIDLHIIAGRPAEEFRQIGVDRAALHDLAERTGGRVIDLANVEGSPIVAPPRRLSLSVPLMLLSALSAAAAIALGRR